MAAWFVCTLSVAGIITVELVTRLLSRRWVSILALLMASNVVPACFAATIAPDEWTGPLMVTSIALCSYTVVRLLFYVPRAGPIRIGRRLRIMMGGRRIFLVSLWVMGILLVSGTALWVLRFSIGLTNGESIAALASAFGIASLVMITGGIRMLSTSRRLGIGKRLLFLMAAWVPLANIALLWWFSTIVKREFEHDLSQAEIQEARAENEICKTRYPLLLLHGAGFRDYRFLNYWGRIPSKLKKNGATVFYGRQQAWGPIEQNAQEVKTALLDTLSETGADKVNIIAHSKGGLDARYLISTLGMGDQVASLTTIATPHHGSEMVNVLQGMSKKTYNKYCRLIESFYKKLGDKAPDVQAVAEQLSPKGLAKFNEENPNVDGVHYQSYAAEMKGPASCGLLSVPNFMMKRVTGSNDGLVTIESSKWGEFKGTFKSKTRRGISHADLIDLMNQDYEGFNMAEEYVTIVAELKERGL